MNPPSGSRIGLVGASSLLGRELSKVLKERNFPILTSVAIEPHQKEPDIPVLDVESEPLESIQLEDLRAEDFDFIFVASALPADGWPMLLARVQVAARVRMTAPAPVVISLVQLPAGTAGAVLCAPGQNIPIDRSGVNGPRLLRSPHAASVVLSTLLLRLAAQFRMVRVVAEIFAPASHLGPAAIEELQEQTLKLMSFQKIPQAVFGNQMAFNMLPRLGRAAGAVLRELEARIRQELGVMLAGRVPALAIRVVQVPVFFSTAFSVYVEVEPKADAAGAAQAIRGGGVQVQRLSRPPATQVEAAGSADIMVDVAVDGAAAPSGLWLWAAVDDLQLAAKCAVEIAEQLNKKEVLH